MKVNFSLFLLFSLAIFFAFSCSNQNVNNEEKSNSPLADDEDYLITITTDFGKIQIVLYDETPKHKANFIKLAKEGFYDNLLFHRVIKTFMIQGGDPQSKYALPKTKLGNGTTGYQIDAEIKKGLFHQKGALAAARLGGIQNPKKKSNGSQFYLVQGKTYTKQELTDMNINHKLLYHLIGELFKKEKYTELKNQYIAIQEEKNKQKLQQFIIDNKGTVEKEFNLELDNPISRKEFEIYTTIGGTPQLDGEYTVFGIAISGLEVIDKIAELKTDTVNKPVDNVSMKIKLKKMKKSEIQKLMNK